LISAIDTNVLLDVLRPNSEFAAQSEAVLLDAREQGSLVICEAVFAELVAALDPGDTMTRFMIQTGIRLESSDPRTLRLAGSVWSQYIMRRPRNLICPQCGTTNQVPCRNCGETLRVRQHMVADFIIGAHAQRQAECLITRDRGYFRTYFPDLKLI
jgi:predicted nucleic acid-binding protein